MRQPKKHEVLYGPEGNGTSGVGQLKEPVDAISYFLETKADSRPETCKHAKHDHWKYWPLLVAMH